MGGILSQCVIKPSGCIYTSEYLFCQLYFNKVGGGTIKRKTSFNKIRKRWGSIWDRSWHLSHCRDFVKDRPALWKNFWAHVQLSPSPRWTLMARPQNSLIPKSSNSSTSWLTDQYSQKWPNFIRANLASNKNPYLQINKNASFSSVPHSSGIGNWIYPHCLSFSCL